jgi:hypothetical protein
MGKWMYRSIFLTSELIGDEWSASRAGRFNPGERAPGIHWIGGWMDPRACLDDVEKRKLLTLPGFELRPLGHPARSQLLYWLRYLGSEYPAVNVLKITTQMGSTFQAPKLPELRSYAYLLIESALGIQNDIYLWYRQTVETFTGFIKFN